MSLAPVTSNTLCCRWCIRCLSIWSKRPERLDCWWSLQQNECKDIPIERPYAMSVTAGWNERKRQEREKKREGEERKERKEERGWKRQREGDRTERAGAISEWNMPLRCCQAKTSEFFGSSPRWTTEAISMWVAVRCISAGPGYMVHCLFVSEWP